MRIIAGTLKGRRLFTPKDRDIRPTSDRVRENLFNILGPAIQGAQFLDLFCGSGACGIEALSRGAAHATFIDESREALKLVQRNLEHCDVTVQSMVMQARIPQELNRPMPPFHLIFADPPYGYASYELLLEVLSTRSLLLPGGTVILETARTQALPERMASLQRTDQRRYGDTSLSFFT